MFTKSARIFRNRVLLLCRSSQQLMLWPASYALAAYQTKKLPDPSVENSSHGGRNF